EHTGSRRIVWGAGTPRTLRAHWILHELGLPYERRRIGSRTGESQTPEYLAINPSGKIPTLQDGDFTLSESAAIVDYIAGRYGRADLLPGPDARERARYDQWRFFAMMELDADTLYVIRRHEDLQAVYGEAPAACATARRVFAQQAIAAARRLGDAPYVMGERFTGADILFTTCITGALRRGIEVPPSLCDYAARTSARPAYRFALADNQPAGAPP
ncbi:MAG: glutathione S-transferase family protein, partial [Burkholderiales bacterium]|nr:glutathione S-transferase family protein [Burkholderiales bacterium]